MNNNSRNTGAFEIMLGKVSAMQLSKRKEEEELFTIRRHYKIVCNQKQL